jgi:hypothetical protein
MIKEVFREILFYRSDVEFCAIATSAIRESKQERNEEENEFLAALDDQAKKAAKEGSRLLQRFFRLLFTEKQIKSKCIQDFIMENKFIQELFDSIGIEVSNHGVRIKYSTQRYDVLR